VDHDGNVTITDVTVLIDYLLGSQEGACLICADVDLDGKVTITDVTELIDMLLAGGN
jgi:high-affinity nickel permease